MKMSIKFRNRLNYSSVGFCGLRYTLTDQRSHSPLPLPRQRRPLYCMKKCTTFSSLTKRDFHASASLRAERNRAGMSIRASHLNQGVHNRDGDLNQEEKEEKEEKEEIEFS